MSTTVIKLGATWLQLRDKPLRPLIKFEKTLLQEEVERLRKQVDTLYNIQQQLTNMNANITDLHRNFIKPKNVTLSAKEKRKLNVANAIAQL